MPPVDDDLPDAARSLRVSLQQLVDARTNLGRQGVCADRLTTVGLQPRTQWIDWSWLSNVWVEIPGESDRIVYVVAHYDRCSWDPLHLMNVSTLGALGPLADLTGWMSDGAIDNGSGSAVALEIARHAARHKPPRTIRVLLTGCEEIGLRGSRTHVASLSDTEVARIDAVLNVDGVGIRGGRLAVAGDLELARHVVRTGRRAGRDICVEDMPAIASSDHAPFNAPGADMLKGIAYSGLSGLLPQRSWFGSAEGSRAVWIGDSVQASGMLLTTILPLPVGEFHGPRDRAERICPRRLHHTYELVRALVYQQPCPKAERIPTRRGSERLPTIRRAPVAEPVMQVRNPRRDPYRP